MTAPYVNQREWIDAVRITAAARRDRLVLLDAYPTYMRDVDDDALRYLLSGATVFLPSEAELRARFSGKSIEDALRQLLDLGPAAIALKRGPEGAFSRRVKAFSPCQASRSRRKIPRVPATALRVVSRSAGWKRGTRLWRACTGPCRPPSWSRSSDSFTCSPSGERTPMLVWSVCARVWIVL